MGEGCSGVEVLPWLKTLPVAPEYHPTLDEFRDPIAYIFKIEAEASRYGICKIVPPVAAPTKKSAISNLNKSLSARPGSNGPTFTTRQQQIGFCPRKLRPLQKPVWQSGEHYTLQQFEAKAKGFEKSFIKRSSKKGLSPLEVESLYWKANLDKPFSVEYANDIPGSAFAPKKGDSSRAVWEGATVAETEWNMRGVSRAKGSLLKFMKEEIPGVTSPMVYIAMMFSWFAWHVEDHDLHSLNYLHTGAGKTWYGVPRDAAVAFEEVIRVHGYGGEVNPLVTFATLGEKTTVMSPEVLLNAGVPCCRLVQDVGDFVVTFPRAYHSGFSHGFNCGEASNIATPGWLRVAKDAAIRRASINCPPMVSHFQLLYDLAISLCSSMSKSIRAEPRSSRLKDKKKDEGEALVKGFFVQDLKQTNSLLHILGGGSSVVLLPRNSTNLQGPPLKIKPEVKPTKDSGFENVSLGRKQRPKQTPGALSKDGLFSCVTCGILCYTCVAIVQPTDEAAHCLLSADCESIVQLGAAECGTQSENGDADVSTSGSSSGLMVRRAEDDIFDAPIESTNRTEVFSDKRVGVVSTTGTHKDGSALGLLASMYGDSSSDSEPEADDDSPHVKDCEGRSTVCLSQVNDDVIPLQFVLDPYAHHRARRTKHGGGNRCSFGSSVDAKTDADENNNNNNNNNNNTTSILSKVSQDRLGDHVKSQEAGLNYTQFSHNPGVVKNAHVSFSDVSTQSDEDSSRMHVFCLQHAVEVEKKLRPIGGAHVSLFCHPDYPQLEAEARKLAGDSGIDYIWSESSFHEATVGDKKLIRSALESQEAIHGNGDWAVRLGINLFHSASLSRSTLYCKQMAHNSVIYTAFGRSVGPENDVVGPTKHKKVSVSGKWCGKFWMSNQVHPLLSHMASSDQPDPQQTNPAARSGPDRKPTLLSLEEGKRAPETAAPTFRKKRKSAVMENGGFLANNDRPDEKPMPDHKNKQVKREPYDEPQKIIPKNEGFNVLDKDDEVDGGPSTRLRRRISKPVEDSETEPVKAKPMLKAAKRKKGPMMKKVPDGGNNSSTRRKTINKKSARDEEEHLCDLEGCNMSFRSRQELQLHKKNICPVKGCGKNFFSHKYLVQHRRVHMDERPLKCPWKGCKMTFKWSWARTEHIRVHTGARPYLCPETGCGQTFRFVSDFSRHKRKTGHNSNK